MFVSENVSALFKKGTLKLMETDEGCRRMAEATLVIEPFPIDLARELGDEVAGHLFTDDGMIRPELQSIDLRPRVGLQRVMVRLDKALEPLGVLEAVSVKDMRAQVMDDKKTQGRWLTLQFVLVFSLAARAARNFVLDEFGKTLLWSFVGLQRDLLRDADLHEAAARLGELGSSSVAVVRPDGTTGEPIHFNPESAKRNRAKAADLRKAAGVN